MQALVLNELKKPLSFETGPDPEPGEGQVVVQLRAAALNRRDYWITQGMYPGIRTPVILGCDGAGVVSQIGDGVAHHWSGQEVVFDPGWNWGDNEAAQGANYQILGMPDDGTFATHVVVRAACLQQRPEHLDWHQSAALSLGGLTAYRAVFRQGKLQPGENVLIHGVGGGVASFALQFAIAAGARVFVTSSSPQKLEAAAALGAVAGFDYGRDTWHKEAKQEHGGMQLIIDSAGGSGYQQLVDLAAPGGRIVSYGATAGPARQLDLFRVFWKQLHLIGSTMGSPTDYRQMLQFVRDRRLEPVVDQVFPLSDGNRALERMREARQFGKIVLDTC